MPTSPLQFMSLLTPDEQAKIAGAALQSPAILLYMLKLSAATYVDPHDPATAGGLQAMAAYGLLTSDRADAVQTELLGAVAAPRRVTSSEAVPGNPQSDGRFWVTEVFTLDDGSVLTSNILYEPGTDFEAELSRHTADMNAQLAQPVSV